MTLIVTCAQPTSVIQVSDRRLVDPDTGQVVDEYAQKGIYVACVNARFALAYTGIARIQGKATNEWLLAALADLDGISQMPIQDVKRRLIEKLNETFKRLPERHRPYRAFTVVLSGFYGRHYFIERISNTYDERGVLGPPRDDFSTHSKYNVDAPTSKLCDLAVTGRTVAVEGTIDRRLATLRRRLFGEPPDEIMETLTGLIRAARRHPTEGHYVGDQATGLIVTREHTGFIGGSLGRAKVVGGRQIADAPPIIVGGLVVSSIELEVPAPKSNGT